MTLTTGTRLGPYEIISALGAGGMGEVYRARDSRLGREVAIKVLPEAFASDPDRLARFQREAQVLASLNHPHIATIHGLEHVGGTNLLVMELVEGGTLADRLKAGRLPVADALAIARQVAEALQAAHEKGIIHRDLKPANIAFTADGQVKVLDFGLAKVAGPPEGGPHDGDVGAGFSRPSATHSPTLSIAATQAGVILGTAAYMAPEQAKGRVVDKRSDVWAFGCVLYEMLTGTRAFDGEDAADIIGAVVRLDPDWQALPADTPARVRRLVKQCLEKDRRKRIADISTALFVLDDVDEKTDVTAVPASRPGWRRVAAFVAAALVVGAAIAGAATWLVTRPTPPRVARTTLVVPNDAGLRIDGNDRDLVITPDGTRVIYAGSSVGGTQIFIRRLDTLEPSSLVAPIAITVQGGGAQGLFTSPDGEWVGYVDNNVILKKVAIGGGPPLTLGTMDGNSRGVTWAADDRLIFATNSTVTGLQSVPAAGGTATVVTRPDAARGEADHLWPEVLPGGRKILFTILPLVGTPDQGQIAVLDLASGSYTTVLTGGSHAHYVASGHLLYAAGDTARAVAFDLETLETRGTPVPVLPRVLTTPVGAVDLSVAADGTLVYVDAPQASAARTLVWVDRGGRETALDIPPRVYQSPRLSPDGTRVALYVNEQEQDIWIADVARSTLTRLTFEPGIDNSPVWTPDGRRVVFSSQSGGIGSLYARSADGTGGKERLSEAKNTQVPTGVTPDGAAVVFHEPLAQGTAPDLFALPIAGPPQPNIGSRVVTPLMETRFAERNGTVSPDGRWLAYESNTSGTYEIYVRPFPNVGGGQWQVSTAGGLQPLWAPNGGELFFIAPSSALMGVTIDARGPTFSAGTPATLVDVTTDSRYVTAAQITRMYDVSPDGQRFLMLKQVTNQGGTVPQMIVIQNFFEELKRLLPVN